MTEIVKPAGDQNNPANQQEDNAPASIPRRKTLKLIVGGVGAMTAYHVLPETWEKPLIEQVFLPAYAGTSGTTLDDPCTVSRMAGTRSTDSVKIRVDGYVTPAVSGLNAQIVATPSGAGSAVTITTTTGDDGTFSADVIITGGPGITGVSVQSSVTGASGVAVCSVNIPAAGTTSEPTTTPTFTTP